MMQLFFSYTMNSIKRGDILNIYINFDLKYTLIVCVWVSIQNMFPQSYTNKGYLLRLDTLVWVVYTTAKNLGSENV